MAHPISLEFLIITGCIVNMDAGSFFLIEEPVSPSGFLLEYPDESAFPELNCPPMLYASYLMHLPNVSTSIALVVMLPDKIALDIFNAWCKKNDVDADYWAGTAPIGNPWQSVEPHEFESDRVIQLAWNRIQAYEKNRT